MFSIIRVDSRVSEGLEQLGTKRKFWYHDDKRRMLFKAEERGTGEDWAEKIGCELAGLLGLPHVHYVLAVEMGSEKPGVVCESCATGYMGLPLGNQLMLERDASYPADQGNRYKVKQHTVDAVAQIIATLQPVPASWAGNLPNDVRSALDIFAGYVMLDAWIANQDRHHENWAALRQGPTLFLAPSFDHGASLARNHSDEDRKDRLESKNSERQIPYFAQRARSAFYADVNAPRPMTTLEAWLAFAAKVPQAANAWQDRLRGVDEVAMRRVIEEVPPHRLSSIGCEFTLRLLLENQKRILVGAGG
jgi:hypothetical protein